MTKKITISVPDELHEKMDKWKNSFNFSRVFQETIEEEIFRKEDFQKRLKEGENMDAVVERLRKEKEKSEHEWFEIGKKDGLEWAKAAHYVDFQYALQFTPLKEERMSANIIGADPTKDDHLGEYFSDIFEEYDELNFEETSYNNSTPNEFYIEWEAGWAEGVQEFWKEIKGKL